MIPFFTFCFLAAVSFLAWRLLKWVWFEPRKLEKQLRDLGFRGNPYRFLHGDYKEIKAIFKEAHSKPLLNLSDDILPRTIPHVVETVKKHGKNSYIWFGPSPSVVIMEPELIREITQNFKAFHKARPNPLGKYVAQGIARHEGSKWSKQRKLLNPVFHMEKLKLMIPAFYQSASQMLGKWDDILSEKGSSEVDVWPYLQTLTGDVISRTAFGSDYEEGKRIFELQREQTEHLLESLRSVYFPGLRFLPTKRSRRMKQIAREVNNTIKEIIDARVMKPMAAGNDLLGLLLESMSPENGKHGSSSKSGRMSIEDVIEECKLFYLAGQETTSVLLVWTMVLLSRFQEWQSRAREEVLHIFGTDKPDFDGLNRLKIVNMILHEVLRLYPAVTILARRTVEETRLGDLTLPAGVLFTIPTILVHRDREIWGDDAQEFNPERFTEGVSHATKGQVVFFPFGWGPRICIGQNFAMLEAKLAMAMILQRFSFELSPSYSHAPRQVITLQPQHGAHLILHKLL